jgi:hypothetical protein
MNAPSLETAIGAWTAATPEARAEAVNALRGATRDPADAVRVLRWPQAAARAGVSVRTLRSWSRAAGVAPVRLPGRSRSYGLRAADLNALIGGRS